MQINYYVKSRKLLPQQASSQRSINLSTREPFHRTSTTRTTQKLPSVPLRETTQSFTKSVVELENVQKTYLINTQRKECDDKYGNMFTVYQQTKKSIEGGTLTSRRLGKLLKPHEAREKHLQRGIDLNAKVDTIDQKLKVANYVFNMKQNVLLKNQNVTSILKRYQEQQSTNSSGPKTGKDVAFLVNIKRLFLQKKKMKQQLIEHNMNVSQMLI